MARWRIPLLLAAVCLGLGGGLVWQLSAPPPSLDKSAPPAGEEAADDTDEADADEDTPQAGDDFSLPPLSNFSAIVERPLFVRGRRPAPPASETTTTATTEGPSPFVLSGVVIAGGRRVAFLQNRASPKTLRVEEGETIEGWKVITIRPQMVTLSSGTNKDELKLPDRIGTAPPPPRQPPRQPGADQAHPADGQPPLPPGRPTEQPPDMDTEQ